MIHFFDTFATPLGPFSLVVNETGAVTATAFGEETALRRRAGPIRLVANVDRTATAREQVLGFLRGTRRHFDLVLQARGTPFQQRVWAALQEIPYGETRSYQQLAESLDTAPRAIGRANGTNPICLIVPCHRVIGSDGRLTGFAFGEELKQRLLWLEAKTASQRAAG
jgi:methylated-DNA-[protein]-cysteine S-methyltransferase